LAQDPRQIKQAFALVLWDGVIAAEQF